MDKYLTLNKLCKNCFNEKYILKDGFLICANCGLIIQDLTYSNDFEPIGFLENEYKAYTIMKEIKEKEPNIKENDLLLRIKKEMKIINYLI